MSAHAAVVVPTRDRPAALRRCLDALTVQTIASELEVIVVDDGGVDAAVVAEIVASAGARLVRTEGLGPAAARNRGVAATNAPVVLLTDDDCLPSPRWAELLVAALADGGTSVVRGTTLPSRPDHPLLVANELIVEELARATPFAPTSNLAGPRALLREQPFDERFPLAAGEDREWCLRLWRLGIPFAHEPEAVVAHDAEMTLAAFWRRHVRYGRAARRLGRFGMMPASERSRLRFPFALVHTGFGHGSRIGAAVALAQLATLGGFVSEMIRPVGGSS